VENEEEVESPEDNPRDSHFPGGTTNIPTAQTFDLDAAIRKAHSQIFEQLRCCSTKLRFKD